MARTYVTLETMKEDGKLYDNKLRDTVESLIPTLMRAVMQRICWSCRGEIFCAAGLPVPMREMRISASLFHVSKPERVSGAFLSRYRTMLKDRNRTHRFS